ncbi:MAG: DNA-processing protein DprA [Oceanococcaceae bacterium]
MTAHDTWLTLGLAPRGLQRRLRETLAAGHCAEETLDLMRAEARRIARERPQHAQTLQRWLAGPDATQLDACHAWLDADTNRQFLTREHPHWPRAFAGVGGMPLLLYAEGDTELLRTPALAVVGSRNPTPTGARIAERMCRALGAAGLSIISGLASGIDACAHRGALRGQGITVAVCGRGLDDTYPARNRELARDIARTGLLLSEYSPGTPPARGHFPARNRIIAALGRGTLVVEAALGSGSLITARQALQYGREVFAVPGSIDNPLARGCHQLLRDGAHLVESPADIVDVLAPGLAQGGLLQYEDDAGAHPALPSATDPAADDPQQRCLLDALDATPTGIDTLVSRTGLPAADISSMLLILELQGAVAMAPGGGYQKLGK